MKFRIEIFELTSIPHIYHIEADTEKEGIKKAMLGETEKSFKVGDGEVVSREFGQVIEQLT